MEIACVICDSGDVSGQFCLFDKASEAYIRVSLRVFLLMVLLKVL